MSAYHRYLCARGYASGYRWTRVAIARDWLRFTGGRLEVDHRDVERWLVGRDVSAGTGRNYLVALRGLYRWLRREGLCERDPCELVDAPPMPRRLPRPAAERAIARLLAGAAVDVRADGGVDGLRRSALHRMLTPRLG